MKSIRDETLHVEGMSQLFRTFIAENPELWNDELKYEIYCAAERTVELEDAFIDLCFEGADVPDLTAMMREKSKSIFAILLTEDFLVLV